MCLVLISWLLIETSLEVFVAAVVELEHTQIGALDAHLLHSHFLCFKPNGAVTLGSTSRASFCIDFRSCFVLVITAALLYVICHMLHVHCVRGHITYLMTDGTPGLEILYQGRWMPVPYIPGEVP